MLNWQATYLPRDLLIDNQLGAVVMDTFETMGFLQSRLFHDVQMSGIFSDSKTIADAVPRGELKAILDTYNAEAVQDLGSFVRQHFLVPDRQSSITLDSHSAESHVRQLWPHLRRDGGPASDGSLLSYPYPYVVSGGRSDEMYYWDSYFTMLGLAVDGEIDLIYDTVRNFAHCIDTYGHIPTGNRTYYTSRSQPPFFSFMVELLMALSGKDYHLEFIDQLLTEHEYWYLRDMSQGKARAGHYVEVGADDVLARYWDADNAPRPESYREDYLMRETSQDPIIYRHLRAACESGWNFSSRWCSSPWDLASIRTTAILPVDLNGLLYHLESLLSRALDKQGNRKESARFHRYAASRRVSLTKYCYDWQDHFFFDYDYARSMKIQRYYASAIVPMYVGMLDADVARIFARRYMEELLAPGGIITSQITSGQQWDAPHGLAPLQWMAYAAMRRYGLVEYAEQIKSRWISTVERYYRDHGKLVEKYNVMSNDPATGGPYENQDGFGWTNGVYMAMKHDLWDRISEASVV